MEKNDRLRSLAMGLLGLVGVGLFAFDLGKIIVLRASGLAAQAIVTERRDPTFTNLSYRFTVGASLLTGSEDYGIPDRWFQRIPEEGQTIEVLYLANAPEWNAPKESSRVRLLLFSLWVALSAAIAYEGFRRCRLAFQP